MNFNNSFSIKELQTALDHLYTLDVGADNLNSEILKNIPKKCLNIVLLRYNQNLVYR